MQTCFTHFTLIRFQTGLFIRFRIKKPLLGSLIELHDIHFIIYGDNCVPHRTENGLQVTLKFFIFLQQLFFLVFKSPMLQGLPYELKQGLFVDRFGDVIEGSIPYRLSSGVKIWESGNHNYGACNSRLPDLAEKISPLLSFQDYITDDKIKVIFFDGNKSFI